MTLMLKSRPRLGSNCCTILFLESMLKKGINHIVLKIYPDVTFRAAQRGTQLHGPKPLS